jgi:hypothetical protein
MNNMIKLFMSAIILALFGCYSQNINRNSEEFAIDLALANVKLRGELLLIGEFKGDLSPLTYDQYISLLKERETFSTKDVVKNLQKANSHLFLTKKNSFLVAIYSKRLHVILYDDSNTSFTDSIKVFYKNETIPSLEEFIRKTGYQVNK